jgi:hypothetical protein
MGNPSPLAKPLSLLLFDDPRGVGLGVGWMEGGGLLMVLVAVSVVALAVTIGVGRGPSSIRALGGAGFAAALPEGGEASLALIPGMLRVYHWSTELAWRKLKSGSESREWKARGEKEMPH